MGSPDVPVATLLRPHYGPIARRIGTKLRQTYGRPEAEPLPNELVELLLRLRHKERDQARRERV